MSFISGFFQPCLFFLQSEGSNDKCSKCENLSSALIGSLPNYDTELLLCASDSRDLKNVLHISSLIGQEIASLSVDFFKPVLSQSKPMIRIWCFTIVSCQKHLYHQRTLLGEFHLILTWIFEYILPTLSRMSRLKTLLSMLECSLLSFSTSPVTLSILLSSNVSSSRCLCKRSLHAMS